MCFCCHFLKCLSYLCGQHVDSYSLRYKNMGDHKGFCVKSVKHTVPHTEITALENSDFLEALESIYPLLEIVFNFLNYHDLMICRQVKKSWKDMAEKILQKRNQCSWFTYFETGTRPKRYVFKNSYNLNYNNIGMGIILYDFRRIKLNNYICVHSNTMELSRKTVPEYLEEELVPRSIEYCVISCPRVISHFGQFRDKKEIGKGSILDGLFIPKIPNIRMTMFHCKMSRKTIIQKSLKAYIKPNEEVKCLLLFCTRLTPSIYNLLEHLIPVNDASSVAVGGGIIRGTKTFQQSTPTTRIYDGNDTFCIAFLQDHSSKPEFNAFSYIIYGDDLSKTEFEEELVKFKKRIILRTNNVAIRVCCSAKVASEEELDIFNKVFPQIPLLGLNADGEIGWNCLLPSQETDDDEESKVKKAKTYPKLQHHWSTVIVLLTWGSIKPK